MSQKNSKFITLKQAAEISGYAPDYIGQLIRKGKLPGKQVYYNVAWMTTESDIRYYMARTSNQQKKQNWNEGLWEKIRELKARMFLEAQMTKMLKVFFYLVIALSVAFCLLLFYVLSVNLDKRFEKKSEAPTETEQIQNTNSPITF